MTSAVDIESDVLPAESALTHPLDGASRGPVGTEPPASIVIFGASGDLTARKLMPALYHLDLAGCLSPETIIVGVARRRKSDDAFREEMRDSVGQHARTRPIDPRSWERFARRLHYRVVEFDTPQHYEELREFLEAHEAEHSLRGDRVFYLATAPEYYELIVGRLAAGALIRPYRSDLWSRVVFEKPFGRDIDSARALNSHITAYLREEQIYRIDHYLGKDTVQNIMAFRLGNGIFEPLFNRRHVDHVQITVAEDQGVEGDRGAYYDRYGAARDVFQNHVLQLLCLIAMEPPAVSGAKEIRDEKVKVLRCLRMTGAFDSWAVRGMYGPGVVGGRPVPGYRDEPRVAPKSSTETFVAARVGIENWRWAGVPFYLRTGKRMPSRRTEIAVCFKQPPTHLFRTVACVGDYCRLTPGRPNALLFRIQPDEGVHLLLSVKRPGMNMELHQVLMSFRYASAFADSLPEAYERLLMDVLRGDQTLFTRSDEIEYAWDFLTPLLDHWEANPPADFPNYAAGTWGPPAAERLLAADPGWFNEETW
jgi:glucose-6-phosphate 1-dehydrogenase